MNTIFRYGGIRMAKIEWSSDKDKYEAIGYLAKPGIISMIEATVPGDLLEKFKNEYSEECYSPEFPYILKPKAKFGYQFRIYLNDIDGCPSGLQMFLDDKYQNRINNTSFIAGLIKEFGFKFTKENQNVERIIEKVNEHGEDCIKWFNQGFNVYSNFLNTLTNKIVLGEVTAPIIVKQIPMSDKHGQAKSYEQKSAFTKEQLLNLGWLGEAYFYQMLVDKNAEILDELGFGNQEYSVEWFNEGCFESETWKDQSVGKGCDIKAKVSGEHVYIEVKTSKRKNKFFVMTSKEMQMMKNKVDNYIIIKIDCLENLLHDKAPEIMVFKSPYNTFFKPEKMKESIFIIEGEKDE